MWDNMIVILVLIFAGAGPITYWALWKDKSGQTGDKKQDRTNKNS